MSEEYIIRRKKMSREFYQELGKKSAEAKKAKGIKQPFADKEAAREAGKRGAEARWSKVRGKNEKDISQETQEGRR